MRTKVLIRISLALVVLVLFYCKRTETKPSVTAMDLPANNLLSDLSGIDMGELQWMYEPESFSFENGRLQVIAEKGTDFFNNPADSTITSTAPSGLKLK